MADVAPAAGPAAVAAPARQQGGGMQGVATTVLRMALMWYVMSWLKGKKVAPPPPGAGAVLSSPDIVYPRFSKGEPLDVFVFLSEHPHIDQYSPSELIWSETAVPLAAGDERSHSVEYFPSEAMRQHNASLYMHVVFAKAGNPIDVSDPNYNPESVVVASHNLIRYMPRPKKKSGHNLLSGGTGKNARSLLPWAKPVNDTVENGAAEVPNSPEETAIAEAASKEFVSFFKPNITIGMVEQFDSYRLDSIPPQVAPFLHISTTESGGQMYNPVIFFDEFWLLRDKHIMLNSTVTNVTLHLKLSRISAAWFQIMHQMEKSFEMQVDMGMSKDGESEELKRVLLEGNPILLVVTFCVSMLHTVFDMLAFKNDIGFWKNNKSMEGLSARSVIINAACQLVILLYLIDNETSYVVLFSSFLGTVIEFWKVTKAMKVKVTSSFPYIKVSDRASYGDSATKQYDKEAMTYLGWVMYPLLVGYCIYTLMYQSHKSWYSWVVGSCVGAVYMFGFILMCPQLYLNYKLKSVAHLPWRQMTYKFLNTIIDDLFAFVIKMPTLHRLSVFRDDLVFLVYIYQRWIYRVDKTRVNEFGFSGQTEEEVAAAAAAPAAVTNSAPLEQAGTTQLLQDGTADRHGESDVTAISKSVAKKDK